MLGVATFTALVGGQAHAQSNPALEPKKPQTPAILVPATPTGGVADPEPVAIPKLVGVVILDSREKLNATSVSGITGVQVRGVDFLKVKDAEKIIKPYLGRPARLSDLRWMQKDIIRFCQGSLDRLLVDVWFPEQNIENGVVQLIVTEGKINKVRVVNEGRKYFSDNLVKSKFHLQEGQRVSSSSINQDIDLANQNSFFRQINMVFQAPAAGADNNTDVELRVQDRFPARVFLGYEDSGNKIMGDHRVLGGLNYGNVFGLDHQLNYQFMADIDFKYLKAHSLSYVAPLPWQHTLTVYGSYARLEANLATIKMNPITLSGDFYQVGARYRVPLQPISGLRHGISLGFDYKRTDNDLAFGGASVFRVPVEIGQWLLDYDASLPDRFGVTSMDLQWYYGPGGWFSASHDRQFQANRTGSDAEYFYGRLQVRRETPLYKGISWVIQANGQWSNNRLLASEQIGAGGYSTVRGYDERVANGDAGFIINNEIYSPAISLGFDRLCPSHAKPGSIDDQIKSGSLQFLVFQDYAAIYSRNYNRGVDQLNANLSSVGAGFRLKIRNNLSMRFDYGYQLFDRRLGYNDYRSRIHLGVVGSF